MEVSDYENIDAFSYQGLMAVADAPAHDDEGNVENRNEAEKFADEVEKRADKKTGVRPTMKIGGAMLLQACAIGTVLIACWFLESGSVVVWWCEAWYWMFVWYTVVCFSSVLENFAGVPFTHTWTIRAWRAPAVEIDEDAPWVIRRTVENRRGVGHLPPASDPDVEQDPPQMAGHQSLMSACGGGANTDRRVWTSASSDSLTQGGPRRDRRHTQFDGFTDDSASLLDRLESGFSVKGAVRMDPTRAWTQADDAFYVLLSVKGISHGHATLRVVSKIVSIGIFAFGTGVFASATLITILEAMVTATLILCAGIFGRVTAMWMASTMMTNRPVLHRVVQNRSEAGKYLEAIFRKRGIAYEVKGHVIIQGRCVKRFGMPIRWTSIFGVLARPYDLTHIAVNPEQARKVRNQHTSSGYHDHV